MLLLCNLHVWVPLKAVQLTLSSPSLYGLSVCGVQGLKSAIGQTFCLWTLSEFPPSPLCAPNWLCLRRARLLQKLKLNDCGTLLKSVLSLDGELP
jgi:hypothetical protein